jgi:hypothetical protein
MLTICCFTICLFISPDCTGHPKIEHCSPERPICFTICSICFTICLTKKTAQKTDDDYGLLSTRTEAQKAAPPGEARVASSSERGKLFVSRISLLVLDPCQPECEVEVELGSRGKGGRGRETGRVGNVDTNYGADRDGHN